MADVETYIHRSGRTGRAGRKGVCITLSTGFAQEAVLQSIEKAVGNPFTRIGAPHAAMALMEAKVEKNLRNTINRQVNCETANLVKTADAAARQIAAIRAVLDTRGEEAFPENLRETVRLRLDYPTDTLAELAQRFDPPISKPGLSHRLKKITEFASKED